MLRPEEVELLVCGNPNLKMADLRKVTVYDGYTAQDSIIRCFWELLLELPLDMQKRFLLFTTGSDRIPVGGMSEMTFKISKVDNTNMWVLMGRQLHCMQYRKTSSSLYENLKSKGDIRFWKFVIFVPESNCDNPTAVKLPLPIVINTHTHLKHWRAVIYCVIPIRRALPNRRAKKVNNPRLVPSINWAQVYRTSESWNQEITSSTTIQFSRFRISLELAVFQESGTKFL